MPESLVGLAAGLRAGHFSAVEVTERYLERIRQLDGAIRAVIELNPDALDIARKLDATQTRGALHGVPILIKDNIETADRMLTTAGSLALLDSRPQADAPLVKRLRAAGAVLLGKTNLSEWANMRSTHSTSGWSARGGQTRHPHAPEYNPSGSSSGSAAAVAARMCAGAIGTETDGSIVSPASACGVVGLKPTLGRISGRGIVPITHWQDTAGPMAGSVADAALLMHVLGEHAQNDFTTDLVKTDLRGLRLGFLRHLNGDHEEVQTLTQAALDVLRALGAEIIETELPHTREIAALRFRAMLGEFRDDLDAYLATTSSKMRSMDDVIAFNETNREKEMPHFGQELLEMAAKLNTDSARAETRAVREEARRLARDEGIDKVLREQRLDALVLSTSDPAEKTDYTRRAGGRGCSTVPATAGYPHLTLPMGRVGPLPVGFSIFSTADTESLLLRIGHALERGLTSHSGASPGPAR